MTIVIIIIIIFFLNHKERDSKVSHPQNINIKRNIKGNTKEGDINQTS